jgi:hypothetical protein
MRKEDVKMILYGVGILMLDIVILAVFYFGYIALWLIAGAIG